MVKITQVRHLSKRKIIADSMCVYIVYVFVYVCCELQKLIFLAYAHMLLVNYVFSF